MKKMILSILAALVVPTPLAAEEGVPIVIGRSYEVTPRAVAGPRRLNVYLPPSYGDGAARFPVVYLLDGGEQEDFHHISGIVSMAPLGRALREAIVVGITSPDRRRDFTSPASDPRDRAEFPTSGGSAAFRHYIRSEVMPWVEARYRTSGETILIGESLAGLFVVETLLEAPDLFDHYVAASPSLWWNGGALAESASSRLAARRPSGRSLYLTVADEGGSMLRGVEDLARAVEALPDDQVRLRYEPMPAEKHNSIYHGATWRALRWLLPVPEEPQ